MLEPLLKCQSFGKSKARESVLVVQTRTEQSLIVRDDEERQRPCERTNLGLPTQPRTETYDCSVNHACWLGVGDSQQSVSHGCMCAFRKRSGCSISHHAHQSLCCGNVVRLDVCSVAMRHQCAGTSPRLEVSNKSKKKRKCISSHAYAAAGSSRCCCRTVIDSLRLHHVQARDVSPAFLPARALP